MQIGYAHNDHHHWVARHTKQTLSPLGIEVANLLGYVGGGIYNAPINHRRVNWEDDFCVSVVWNRDLTNWDRCDLSLLWVECMRRMLRFEIEAAAPGRLRLIFHKRHTRDMSAPLYKRIPDCEQMIQMVDAHFGRIESEASE